MLCPLVCHEPRIYSVGLSAGERDNNLLGHDPYRDLNNRGGESCGLTRWHLGQSPRPNINASHLMQALKKRRHTERNVRQAPAEETTKKRMDTLQHPTTEATMEDVREDNAAITKAYVEGAFGTLGEDITEI
ncbi:hypothetical protein NDU88_001236 [Pleurodeles waltl]|uniref:Uncharacterized protein n=1 Tax=Pleurodeles waltl TaxID=8319 RepID=A0AAV7LX24_PLEWA|nr:hypothetical protein NDU88_001236 [Pleurodeles waltl]